MKCGDVDLEVKNGSIKIIVNGNREEKEILYEG